MRAEIVHMGPALLLNDISVNELFCITYMVASSL